MRSERDNIVRVEKEGLWELKNDTENLFSRRRPIESQYQRSILFYFSYDINKYIHVVLLHDRLEWLDEQGLSSFYEVPGIATR